MSNISNEQLAAVINLLTGNNDDKQESKEEQKAPVPTREEIEAEVRAQIEAERKQEEDKQEENEESEEDHKRDEREAKYINKSLETDLEKAGVSADVVGSLAGFIDYGTLKNEDGEADEEKVSSLVTLLSKIARREPPKGGVSRNINDDGGLAKYLPNK